MIKRGYEFRDIFGQEWIVDNYDDTDALYICKLKNHNNTVEYFDEKSIKGEDKVKYTLYIGDVQVAEIEGELTANTAYERAVELAEILDSTAILTDNTGAVIRYSVDEEAEEDYFPYESEFDECGFDPYEGGYTWDC